MNLVIHNTRTGEDMPAVDWPTAMIWLHSQPREIQKWAHIRRPGPPVIGQVGSVSVDEKGDFVPYVWVIPTDPRAAVSPHLQFTTDPVVERLWNGDAEC